MTPLEPTLSEPRPVEFEAMPAAARTLWSLICYLRAVFFSLVMLAVLGGVWTTDSADGLPTWLLVLAPLLGIGLLFTWAALWPGAVWSRKRWRLTALALELNTGVIFRREMTVPRSRVQHTEVTQGPLQRRFGLATLTTFTAGERFAAVSIGGLEESRARAVRDELLNRAPDHVV